jgi:glycosyltransferase involved in cell wall biosynthesis
MKKIAFITDKVYPYFIGGQEKRVYEYTKILNKTGKFDIKIVSMNWWGDNKESEYNIQNIAICPKLEIYKRGGKRNIVSSIRFGIATFFYVLKSDDDILDIEIFPYFPIIFAKFATFFKKEKPIITGDWAEYWGKSYWKKYYSIFWFLGVLMERLSFWSCDCIIVNSNFTRKKIEKAFGKNKKHITVLPPVSIDVKKIEQIIGRSKKYDIIYHGRIIAHKHVEHIVDIVKNLLDDDIDVKVLIIGNGPNEDDIKEKVITNKLGDNIEIIDFVDDYDVLIEHIKSARIMIQPSEREGFGITIIEANACGLPVLVINYPDNAAKELIKNGENGFICKNIDDLIQNIRAFFQDNKLDINLKNMSQKSIKKSQQYSKYSMQNKVMKYYENL